MSLWQLPADLAACVLPLTFALDARRHPRFAALLAGVLLAKGRRTVSRWTRAAGLRIDFRACYGLVYRVGRRAERLARALFVRVALPRTSRGPGYTTTRHPARPTSASSTATSGSPGRGWRRTGYGAPSPCRCGRCCTSAARTSPGCRGPTAGRSAPS